MQHYIDPDATAYLTLARRWTEGDVAKAVNGYWSPLGVWLTAALVRAGLPAMTAAVAQNTVAAVCFLGMSLLLFRRFPVAPMLRWLLGAALAVFLSYAVYWQTFNDLWMCAALTASLLILLRSDFLQKPRWWVLLGVCTAAAYYAKAYALPFSFLNIAVCGWMAVRGGAGSRMQWAKMLGTVAAVVVALALPWWMALYHKYGIWTTGTAGTLNLSWYLVGHQTHGSGIGLLIPPPYPDAPYHWEDPWAASGRALPHFWDSPRLFALQVVRVGFTGIKFVKSMGEISGFALPLWILGGCLVSSKRARVFFTTKTLRSLRLTKGSAGSVSLSDLSVLVVKWRILAAQCLTFPALYFLINFESRYLWYLVPVTMILGAAGLQKALPVLGSKWLRVGAAAAFALSFVVYPVSWVYSNRGLGGADARAGQFLKNKGIRGPFATLHPPGLYDKRLAVLAYAGGNTWYPPSRPNFSYAQILADMRRYGIRHLYWLGTEPELAAAAPRDEAGTLLPEITGGTVPTLRIFYLPPRPSRRGR